jgi:hypothetical protein
MSVIPHHRAGRARWSIVLDAQGVCQSARCRPGRLAPESPTRRFSRAKLRCGLARSRRLDFARSTPTASSSKSSPAVSGKNLCGHGDGQIRDGRQFDASGALVVKSDAKPSAGSCELTADGLKGYMRGRVLPSLPHTPGLAPDRKPLRFFSRRRSCISSVTLWT